MRVEDARRAAARRRSRRGRSATAAIASGHPIGSNRPSPFGPIAAQRRRQPQLRIEERAVVADRALAAELAARDVVIRIAAHVLDAPVLERDQHAAGVVAVARAGRAHGLHPLMIAGGRRRSKRGSAAASTARAKRSRDARREPQLLGPLLVGAEDDLGERRPSRSSSSAPALRTTPPAPGASTSTWNCSAQVVAPTRKAWTQAGLRASMRRARRRRAGVVVPLVDVELARRAGQQRVVRPPPRRTRSAPSRSRPPACAPRRRRAPARSAARRGRCRARAAPRACVSAMTSRSRSSGASPSVPSGLTMPPSTMSPSNVAAGGSGCESAYHVTVRTPRAASGGSSAASGESRSCCTTRTVGFGAHALILRPSARRSAESRRYADARKRAAGDGAALHRLGIDVPGDPRHGRDDAAARRGGRAFRARGRCSRSPCWPCSGASAGMPTAAEVRGAAIVGVWLLIGGVGVVTITETHAPVEPDRRAGFDDVAVGRRLPRAWRASASGAARSSAAALGVVGVVVLFSPGGSGAGEPVAPAGDRRGAVLEHGLVLRPAADACPPTRSWSRSSRCSRPGADDDRRRACSTAWARSI